MKFIQLLKKNKKTTFTIGGIMVATTGVGYIIKNQVNKMSKVLAGDLNGDIDIEKIIKNLQEQQENMNQSTKHVNNQKGENINIEDDIEINELYNSDSLDDMLLNGEENIENSLENMLINEVNVIEFDEKDKKFVNNLFSQILEIIDKDDLENFKETREKIPDLFSSLPNNDKKCLKTLQEKGEIYNQIKKLSCTEEFEAKTLNIYKEEGVIAYNDFIVNSSTSDILKIRASRSLLKKASSGIPIDEADMSKKTDVSDFIAIKLQEQKMLLLTNQ